MDTIDLVRREVGRKLADLERLMPPSKWKLSFVARYTAGDLDDADIVVTADTLPELLTCIQRRVEKDK
jgi:hypothetical protein